MKTIHIQCAKCGKHYDEHIGVFAANHGDRLTCWCPECLGKRPSFPENTLIGPGALSMRHAKMAFWWVFGMALAYGFLYYGLGFIDAVLSKIFL